MQRCASKYPPPETKHTQTDLEEKVVIMPEAGERNAKNLDEQRGETDVDDDEEEGGEMPELIDTDEEEAEYIIRRAA